MSQLTPSQILALINSEIVPNGIQGITGQELNVILVQIVGLFQNPLLPSRIVTTSTLLNVAAATDYRIGFQRSVALQPFSIQLDPASAVSQEYVFQDLTGNFNSFPATVLPPAGHNITGRPSIQLQEDYGTGRFVYFGNNVWSVELA
jgi:hypothetical protein